jgi:hypothetical protein
MKTTAIIKDVQKRGDLLISTVLTDQPTGFLLIYRLSALFAPDKWPPATLVQNDVPYNFSK